MQNYGAETSRTAFHGQDHGENKHRAHLERFGPRQALQPELGWRTVCTCGWNSTGYLSAGHAVETALAHQVAQGIDQRLAMVRPSEFRDA